MRSFRRTVVVVVTLVALSLGGVTSVGITTASAAAVADVTIDGITYTTDTSTLPAQATATHYSGLGGAVEIRPSVTINGRAMPVVAIGDSAFSCPFSYDPSFACDRSTYPLTSVVIPDTITTIGEGAFSGNALETIDFPPSVTTIGGGAFSGNKLASVVIPAGITTISETTFMSNKLTSVTIPASVTTVGMGAFWFNDLSSVTIPAGVTTIGSAAFSENSLQTVFLWGEAPSIDTSSDYWEPFHANSGISFYIFPKHRESFTSTNNGWRFYGGSLMDAPGGVDFDPNGHGDKPASQMYLTNPNIAVAASAPSAPGYAFQGWYTRSGSNGLLWDFARPVVGCVTLYAHWKNVFATASTPLIRGTLQVGSTLQADAGSWAPEPALHYGWKRDGADIGTASGSTYDLTIEDLGHTITVSVTASLVGYEDAALTSAPTAPIGAGVFSVAPVPRISGTPRVGVPLTTVAGTWTSGASFTYAWRRSGSSATIATTVGYTPVTADIGKTLTVTVTATRDGFTRRSKTSVASAAVRGQAFTTAPVPTITGTKKSGSVLTAVTGRWAPSSGVTFTYVWKRASTSSGSKTTISGATSKTYRLVTADKGKYITVTVTAKKTGYVSTATASANGGTKIAR